MRDSLMLIQLLAKRSSQHSLPLEDKNETFVPCQSVSFKSKDPVEWGESHMRHFRILFCLIMKTHCTLRSRGVNTSREIRRPLWRDICAFPAEITPRHATSAAAKPIRPPFVLHLSLCTNAKSITGHSRYATRIDSNESISVPCQCGICVCACARWSVC